MTATNTSLRVGDVIYVDPSDRQAYSGLGIVAELATAYHSPSILFPRELGGYCRYYNSDKFPDVPAAWVGTAAFTVIYPMEEL